MRLRKDIEVKRLGPKQFQVASELQPGMFHLVTLHGEFPRGSRGVEEFPPCTCSEGRAAAAFLSEGGVATGRACFHQHQVSVELEEEALGAAGEPSNA